MISGVRLWSFVLLALATSALLYGRGDHDRQVLRTPLSQLPRQVDGWTGRDRPLDARVLQVLGDGEFLSRLYSSPTSGSSVDVFIGYFPSQRSGSSIHSPQNCLPGSGWYFASSQRDTITGDDGQPYHVGEYVISNGSQRQYVIYWYQAHGRSVASEYWAKFFLIKDAITLSRTDGALVRVITPFAANEPVGDAQNRARAFTAHLAPDLHQYIPD